MRRLAVPISILAVVLAGVALAGGGPSRGAVAQDATPHAIVGHTVVGSWIVDTDVDDPENAPALAIFHEDGSFVELHEDGPDGVGTWRAADDTTVELTIIFHATDETGAPAGTVKVRATIEVDREGGTFSAAYTLDFIAPDGTPSGELGPGQAEGTRITVEPMGTPVGPIMFEEGTPAP